MNHRWNFVAKLWVHKDLYAGHSGEIMLKLIDNRELCLAYSYIYWNKTE